MFPDNVYDIEELPPDDRTLSAQKYRKYLHNIAQAAIWTTYIYFAARLFFTFTTPEQTWKMWIMLGVEGLFARKLPPNKEHPTTADPVRPVPEPPTLVPSRNSKVTTPNPPQEITQR
jgi:hypothetical protein